MRLELTVALSNIPRSAIMAAALLLVAIPVAISDVIRWWRRRG